MTRFLGVTRERVFSPGRVDDDGAILRMVADRLRVAGRDVSVLDGDATHWPEPVAGTVVFAMCQGERALTNLERWQARGLRIVNTPQGIRNCQRQRTVAAFEGSHIAFPETLLVDTDGAAPAMAACGAWIKRGDVHATEPDDVVYVDDTVAAQRTLQRFRSRGIARAVVQRHVPGTVVKFYAVLGRFFSCTSAGGAPPLAAGVLSRIDGLGRQAADRLEIEIYGGDCVVDVNGGLQLIDLNDWPSYAFCCAEAASNIAAYLLAQDVASDE